MVELSGAKLKLEIWTWVDKDKLAKLLRENFFMIEIVIIV